MNDMNNNSDMVMAQSDKKSDKNVSFFEFWPSWVMYLPVVVQWVILSIRYGSLTLPFIANPRMHLSGMTNSPKSKLMAQATGKAKQAILPWIMYQVSSNPDDSAEGQANKCIEDAAAEGIYLPFVCKPDIGCRGVGVKLVENKDQLAEIIQSYPGQAQLICQKLSSYEPEVGVFYVKNPKTGDVEIPSMTIKVLPRIIGDGQSQLCDLIAKDPRAGQLQFLYEARHKARWHDVLEKGEELRLVFSASHSKGAIFTDARAHITPELVVAIDEIMQGLPEFYYGRMDVKYKDLDALKAGKDLEIVEVNGASSESIHIWDKDTSFFEAIRALMWQYRTLFQIGNYHRRSGIRPPGIKKFIENWRHERELTRHYPLTD